MGSITVNSDGSIVFVWADDCAPLLDLGTAHVRRASHVEPNAEGKWTADLTPVGGPTFGPYTLRADALKAETDWLADHLVEVA